jgi:putative nucleotidyltransferase with HDIG domain
MPGCMSRADAVKLVEERVKTRNLRKHMLASEVVMRAIARRLGEDEDLWALTGLLHDVDYDETAQDFARHGIVSAGELESRGCPAEMVHAVKAHAGKAPIESRLDRALCCADPITGFLVSCALIRPEKKLAPVDVQFVKNRMAEKGFSRAVSRDQIRQCEDLGIPLDDFIGLALDAMKSISEELGL